MNKFKLLQISIEVNSGSVGRIAEQIGESVINQGGESYITYARNVNPSTSNLLKIGSKYDVYFHGIKTRLFDDHGFGSKRATLKLIRDIEGIDPDVIHLHHLHGYFIHIEILFNFLKLYNKPVVWTFHDCWSFTGHCAYYEFVGCEKWKTQCYNCEQKNEYPKSILFDRSRLNYLDKKRIFNSVDNLTIVPVSKWLEKNVKQSFLKNYPCITIHNGIDLDIFSPKLTKDFLLKKHGIKDKFVLLGVASSWDRRKGFSEFLKLRNRIDSNQFMIILIGLNDQQMRIVDNNYNGIIGVKRTEDAHELAKYYSACDVFVNPTLEDTYPTTNLEAIACGTPVLTYNTGGSIESVNTSIGAIIEKGNIDDLINTIYKFSELGKDYFSENCRKYAISNFDKRLNFKKYLDLYTKLTLECN